MLKIAAAGMSALFLAVSPLAYAQETTGKAVAPSSADWGALTDARINVVKAALQLTPEQEKYWPAVEDAIRARAKNREARISAAASRVRELRSGDLSVLRDRDPVAFLHRRADALAQRAADLKKLADAWQPLYQTLNPDQKRRMAFLAVLVMHEMGNAIEQRRLQSEEEDEAG